MAEQTFTNRKLILVEIKSLLDEISRDKLEFLDPSLLAIQFNSRRSPLDIGSWCHLKRKNSHKASRVVKLNSLVDDRKPVILNILYSILLEISAGKAESSLLTELKSFERFLSWCDENYETKVLSSPLKARKSLISYYQVLKQDIREESITL